MIKFGRFTHFSLHLSMIFTFTLLLIIGSAAQAQVCGKFGCTPPTAQPVHINYSYDTLEQAQAKVQINIDNGTYSSTADFNSDNQVNSADFSIVGKFIDAKNANIQVVDQSKTTYLQQEISVCGKFYNNCY